MTTPTETAVTMTDVVRFIQTIDQEAVSALFDTLNARGRAIRAEASAVAAATIRIGDRVRLEEHQPQVPHRRDGEGRRSQRIEVPDRTRPLGRQVRGRLPSHLRSGLPHRDRRDVMNRQFVTLPANVTATAEDEVETGPLYTVRVDGVRVGEVYRDRAGLFVAAYLESEEPGRVEQVEWPHTKQHLENAVFVVSTLGWRP
jgi:hypothetical protein